MRNNSNNDDEKNVKLILCGRKMKITLIPFILEHLNSIYLIILCAKHRHSLRLGNLFPNGIFTQLNECTLNSQLDVYTVQFECRQQCDVVFVMISAFQHKHMQCSAVNIEFETKLWAIRYGTWMSMSNQFMLSHHALCRRSYHNITHLNGSNIVFRERHV